MTFVLILAGIVGLAAGVLATRRVRRWRPSIDRELGGYDPGPDILDWAQAVTPAALGVVAILLAVVG